MKLPTHHRASPPGEARSPSSQVPGPARRWLTRLALSVFICLSLFADSRLVAPLPSGAVQVVYAAVFSVSKTADTNDGVCDPDCSLREAIIAANAAAGADTIILPPNTYVLTQTGTLEDAALTGDLDITDDLTILISPAGTAIIDGGGIDRVFEIFNTGTPINISISGVTIRNGNFGGTGGIYNHDKSTLILSNSAVSGNGGIGIYNSGSEAVVTLNNDTLSGNLNGGIQNEIGGTLNINNSTLSGNTALNGGGIYATGGVVTLNNATIASNSATNGGGIRRTGGTVFLKNTLLANNSASSGPDCLGVLSSAGFNLMENTTGCTVSSANNIVEQDPNLGSLQNNGGSTLTHALLTGSPAIDAGDDCRDHLGNSLIADQRGTFRPQGGQCDIGAYEVPAVKFANSGAFSVSEVGPTALITATLEGNSANTVTVNYSTTTGGTATASSDYMAASGTLTFTVGVTRTTFPVSIINDSIFEGDQTVLLMLSNPVSGTLGSPPTATLTIVDDDPQPTVQFNPNTYTVNETGSAVLTVTLSTAAERPITVTYGTSNGTAIAGSDYTATSGALAFAPLQTSKSINVPITQDKSDEPDETFTVLLSNPLSVTIAGTNPVTVTILDDDLQIFLPLVMDKYSKFFTGFEVEQNNNSGQANGPLASGSIINGYPDDSRDYFFFDANSTGTITVNLSGHTGSAVQLQLYYQVVDLGHLVTYDPTPPFEFTATNRLPGRYYISIYTGSGYNSTTPYSLTATFP